MLEINELRDFLDEKVDYYNCPKFIETDPIQIPHSFQLKEDIEISGFLTAQLAWGNRKMIISNAKKLMSIMGNSPYDFIMEYNDNQEDKIDFVHRTFSSVDLDYFFRSLKNIYQKYNGLEAVFSLNNSKELQSRISEFKQLFFELEHQQRTEKHLSDPAKGSAAKRINMFLRWMCRKDDRGVDFGIWNSISPSELSCPLDVHSGTIARKLGLIQRKQNDQKALKELDDNLRILDANDPVKYDFALFGLGAIEKF
ncbi:TIGR02757 family protein [Capnocytophaga sp. ARDL2]|uniref:TIGR02757 family protein n=1 Tax=Capnocytophaga sp. ARDL2 TaxID=3238809 RepID=UPI0035581902